MQEGGGGAYEARPVCWIYTLAVESSCCLRCLVCVLFCTNQIALWPLTLSIPLAPSQPCFRHHQKGWAGFQLWGGGCRYGPVARPPSQKGSIDGSPNPTETDPGALEVTRTQNSAKNEKGGGAFGKRAQLTGPLISYYVLWRQRRPKLLLALKMDKIFSPNTWHIMTFLNPLDALIPKIPPHLKTQLSSATAWLTQ